MQSGFLDTKTRLFLPIVLLVDLGILNGAHYQDMLLQQEMLPNICAISGDFIFQQDSAPTCETVALLTARSSALHCCQSATSQQPRPQPFWLQSVGTNTMQEHVYWAKCETLTIWSSVWLTCETVWNKASSTTRSTSGVKHLMPVSMQKRDFLNSLCNLHMNFVIK